MDECKKTGARKAQKWSMYVWRGRGGGWVHRRKRPGSYKTTGKAGKGQHGFKGRVGWTGINAGRLVLLAGGSQQGRLRRVGAGHKIGRVGVELGRFGQAKGSAQ